MLTSEMICENTLNLAALCKVIRRPGSACTVILILCRIENMSAKTPPNQNPKSKIQNPQNPAEKVWILASGFWILGRSRGCTTRQFSDGALRSQARIPLVRLWGAVRNQLYLIRLGKGSELGCKNTRKRK